MSLLLLGTACSGSARAETPAHGGGTPVEAGHGADDGHGHAAAPADGHTTAADGHGGGHEAHVPWDTITYQAVTFLIFVAFLYFAARRPVGDYLKNRALGIRSQLDEAGRLKSEAEARHREIEARLASLDQRVNAMRAEAETEAVKEADRIRERAQADAARIRDTAERTIREEATRARNELRTEAVQLSIALASETLQRTITQADQDRLSREFLQAVDRDARNGNNGSGGPANG